MEVGDFIQTPNEYTTIFVTKIAPSYFGWGDFIYGFPLWDRFPIGKPYAAGQSGDWVTLSPTKSLITEAKRVLLESSKKHGIDNLTYIEILSRLKDYEAKI